MLSWLSKQVVTHTMARLRAGDPGPTLMLDAPDVQMTFPGDNSWAGVHSGKPAHERWLRRFARVGLQIFPDEVVAKGFPWNTTICVRGRDYLQSPHGETIYENRYVIWGRMAWGRLKEYEVYEDTEKTKRLDEYLAAKDPTLMAA
ncbi:MAG: hypothetical protein JOZ98_15625 [Solirubrobacterales bacterium]|nr:hypothetical protein [Solirubrobacterales bacterium]MBV9424343.1 hypothetical protein [Solirubrobacterales bacterium]MBV9798055.1 hypothetical protein [Solirubrobacterales bacterium]